MASIADISKVLQSAGLANTAQAALNTPIEIVIYETTGDALLELTRIVTTITSIEVDPDDSSLIIEIATTRCFSLDQEINCLFFMSSTKEWKLHTVEQPKGQHVYPADVRYP